MSSNPTASVTVGITVLAVISLAIVGFFMNIYKLTQCDFEAPYRAEAVRIIGIPVPIVGMIAGYCDLDDSNTKEEAK